MFELKCYIDDKKLAQVLRVLDGLVYEPRVLPVRNALGTLNGSVKSTAPDDAPAVMYQILCEAVNGDDGIFKAALIKDNMEKVGWKPSSYSWMLEKLIKQRYVKRMGVGQYKLMDVKQHG